MPTQLVPDTVECRFILEGTAAGAYDGKTTSFTLYVASEFGWSQGQVDIVAQYCTDWANSDLVDHLSAAWTVKEVRCRDVGAEFGASTVQTINTAGSLLGDELPASVCMVVQFEGAGPVAPREAWCMPPLGTETEVTDGLYTSAFANLVATSFQTFRDGLSGIAVPSTTQVIVSRSAATNAEKAAIKAARDALKEAIAAARRDEAVTNDVGGIAGRRVVGSQRERR